MARGMVILGNEVIETNEVAINESRILKDVKTLGVKVNKNIKITKDLFRTVLSMKISNN